MIINIAIFFDKETEREIVSYSNKLGIKLKFRPHITLVKFEGEEPSKELMKKIIDRKIKLTFAGLTIVPSHNRVWIEISVLKSKELIELQKEILDVVKIKPRNEIGDNYRPHITLANINENKNINISKLDINLLKKEVTGKVDCYSYEFKIHTK